MKQKFMPKSVSFILICIFGTATVCLSKASFQFSSKGTNSEHKFEKPWSLTDLVFLSSIFLLLIDKIGKCCDKKNQNYQQLPIYRNQKQWKIFLYVIVPSIFDLISKIFLFVALIDLPAGIWQIYRSSIIIFSGIFSLFFLNRKFYIFNWVGILFIIFGLLISLFSEYMKSESDKNSKLVGVIYVLIAQFFLSIQSILENHLYQRIYISKMRISGLQGLFSFILTSAIISIIYFAIGTENNGPKEDIVDTFHMLKNNHNLLYVVIIFFVTSLFYQFSSIHGSLSRSSRMIALAECIRIILIWVLDLIIHYFWSDSFGVEWKSTYSYLQLVIF
ncbi:solute carrier family 35 member f6 [Anaeramoeba ignava]|uniref:Solute carrier family 35 member f6 n=1 Tax=Anaeramoeba ignava TaxID=1746090 RepID=A0A9Q0LXE0_ANAIG|nr:solute carrier family 35 member f6 [Anaeramoeba ignava]